MRGEGVEREKEERKKIITSITALAV